MPNPIILDGAIISVLKKEQNCHAICVWPLMHDKSKLFYVRGQLCFPLQPGQSPGGYAGAPVQRLEW